MAAPATSSSSPPPAPSCSNGSGFIEEFLILPTRNIALFAPTFLVFFAHTFLFLAVAAILRAHSLPLAISGDVVSLSSFDTWSYNHDVILYRTQGLAKKLLLAYLAYLASKLVTQVATVMAASATCLGERPSLLELLRCSERFRGPVVTAAFVGVVELASTALLVALLYWTSASGLASASGGMCLLLPLALVVYLHHGVAFPVSLAVSVAEKDCRGARALGKAWRLMKARRKEAAVLALVASLLPVAVCPVYTFFLGFAEGSGVELVMMMCMLYGFVVPSAGVQLYSLVAAAVFYHQYSLGTLASENTKVASCDEAAVLHV